MSLKLSIFVYLSISNETKHKHAKQQTYKSTNTKNIKDHQTMLQIITAVT